MSDVANRSAAVRRADNGERGRCSVRAAFGAAGNVDDAFGLCGDQRRERARGDMRRGANRRSCTSNDAPPQIVGTRDEAELFGGDDKARRSFRCQSDCHEYSSRGRAKSARSGRRSRFNQPLQRTRIGVAEGKPDTAGE